MKLFVQAQQDACVLGDGSVSTDPKWACDNIYEDWKEYSRPMMRECLLSNQIQAYQEYNTDENKSVIWILSNWSGVCHNRL